MCRIPLCLLMLTLPGFVAAESFEMDVLETDDVRMLYFDPVQTYLVPHMSQSFHNSLMFQKEIFQWQPWEKTNIVLTDLSDYGNAGASVSPGNGVIVYIAPSNRTLETLPANERTFMLMNHELVHLATMDNWNQQDARYRRFFMGKPRHSAKHPESILYNYLTVPRMSSPRWYLEGVAVFLETWMSGGVGRAQGAYDEMVFRSMVRDDAYFYSDLGIVAEGVSVDFQVGVNAYLYGTRFVSYLAYHYSPEKLLEWVGRDADSERYYADQFTRVFGAQLSDVWQDWIAFEKTFQEQNLRRVHETPLTPTEPLVAEALGSISRAFLTPDEKELIGAFRYPGVVAHVGALNMETGKVRWIEEVKGPKAFSVTSAAFDAQSGTLFYTADNNAYRDLMAVNVTTGEGQQLLKDARIGDIVFNPIDRSLWGLRHLNGYVSLVRIPFPYQDYNEIYTWPYGQEAYELDVSADGELLSLSLSEIDGSQRLMVYATSELLTGTVQARHEKSFGFAVPEGFVFSPDGRYLYGSSFYTGVSNIFRYELRTDELEAVSNAETGFFRPIPMQDGKLIVFEYTGQGFVPTVIDPQPLQDLSAITFLGNEIAKKHPVVREWSVIPTLKSTVHEELVTSRGKYRPASELGLGSGYPVLEGYRDAGALGWHFNFADPGQFHRLGITASYSPGQDLASNERLHAEIQYETLNWTFRYWHNDADFYDLFGPTKQSRKGDAVLLGYERALIYDTPRELTLSVDLNYFTGLDTLPTNQNVSTVQFEELTVFDVVLDYEHTRKSLGAVDHEKGVQWEIAASLENAGGETVPKLHAGFDAGVALGWKHSSVWLYNAIGVANGDPSNPLSEFYFGGFGNNYVDDGEIKRYREFDSFPGYDIDELSGERFGKTLLELNLPPKRFREFGTPGLFLSWLRPAVFAGALRTERDQAAARDTYTVGAQVDMEFTLAHRLPMTLSVGYALGIESGTEDRSEWMISLKVL